MKIPKEIGGRYPDLLERATFYDLKQSSWAANKVSPYLSVVEVEDNKMTFEFVVEGNHCNQLGNIHGGCVATVIDLTSTFAILAAPNFTWSKLGVSTDLTVSYLRGVSAGETIRVVCEVQRVGRTLASLFTKIYDSQDRLCYSGTHTKCNIDSKL